MTYLDTDSDRDAQSFTNLISSCGLQKPVHESTHVYGHTLDVVISRDCNYVVSNVYVTDPGLCDHLGGMSKDHDADNYSAAIYRLALYERQYLFGNCEQ